MGYVEGMVVPCDVALLAHRFEVILVLDELFDELCLSPADGMP